jgi:hypothetical protein
MCEAHWQGQGGRVGDSADRGGEGYSKLSVGGLGLVLRIVYSVIFPTFRVNDERRVPFLE